MRTFDQNEVTTRFRHLPEQVQDVCLSDELGAALGNAIRATGLNEVQRQQCNQQATLVMVGLSRIEEFEHYVQTELSLPTESAATLLATLKQEVFAPIQRAMLGAVEVLRTPNSPAVQQSEASPNTSLPVDPYQEPVL